MRKEGAVIQGNFFFLGTLFHNDMAIKFVRQDYAVSLNISCNLSHSDVATKFERNVQEPLCLDINFADCSMIVASSP